MTQTPIRAGVQPGSALGPWLSACVAAIVYATLYPWSGWRSPGVPVLSFLWGPWPRWWTVFDVIANVAAYLPIGFLLTAWLAQRAALRPGPAAAVAAVAATALSLGLESLQMLLPERVPSPLDLLANAAGATAGALFAAAIGARRLGRWPGRMRRIVPLAPRATPGLILMCAWLLAQVDPQRIALVTGTWVGARSAAGSGAWLSDWALPREFGPLAETAGVALTVVAIGLIARELLRAGAGSAASATVPIALALGIKVLASIAWSGRSDPLGWFGASTQGGLLAGAVALLLLAGARRRARLALAIAAMMAATLAGNLVAPDAYDASMRIAPVRGAWASLQALAAAIAATWPAAALAWCLARLRAVPRDWRL